MSEDARLFVVEAEDSGTRLDRFLVKHFPEQSRTALTRLISDGHVAVNDITATKGGQTIEASQRVSVTVPAPPSTPPLPTPKPSATP